MKAARVHEFGSPGVIRVEDVDIPVPGAKEVLVRVALASDGPWDSWIRAGKSVLPQPLPLTLGSDLSGTVVAVGEGVTTLAVGDAVFGVTNKRFTNAYAELAIASAAMIAKKPAGLDDSLAAAAPVVSVTALQMLFDHAKVTSGQRVLVHGAGGNVGAYAVQLAKLEGTFVIGTGSSRARSTSSSTPWAATSRRARSECSRRAVRSSLQYRNRMKRRRRSVA